MNKDTKISTKIDTKIFMGIDVSKPHFDASLMKVINHQKEAIQSADKNFVGLRETTRPAGELLNLVVRPQEVVASLQSLNIAFQDYASAVSTFNRAQFELYRAMGRPAQ